MKKSFYYLALVVGLFVVSSCSKDDEAKGYNSLVDYSAENIPSENVWIITDGTAETEDFEGLRLALAVAKSDQRAIRVELPMMKEIPAAAFALETTRTGGENEVGTGLTEVTLSDKLTSIGEEAFRGAALSSLTIPASIQEIGSSAFQDCELLTELEILAENPPHVGVYVFTNCNPAFQVTVPVGSLDAYEEAWDDFLVIIIEKDDEGDGGDGGSDVGKATRSLNQYLANNLPESNTWVVTDSEAVTEDFQNMSQSLTMVMYFGSPYVCSVKQMAYLG